MASRLHLRFSSIAGPVSPTVAIAPGQPSGVATDASFALLYDQSGAAAATSAIFGSGPGAGKATPIDLTATVEAKGNAALFLGALAGQTVIPRVCSLGFSAATGGVATDWVNHYVLIRDGQFSNVQLQTGEDGIAMVSLQLVYSAAFWAFFATPSGGVIGARTASGWDWKTNTPWNGS